MGGQGSGRGRVRVVGTGLASCAVRSVAHHDGMVQLGGGVVEELSRGNWKCSAGSGGGSVQVVGDSGGGLDRVCGG